MKAEVVSHLSEEGGMAGHSQLSELPAQRPDGLETGACSGECDACLGACIHRRTIQEGS